MNAMPTWTPICHIDDIPVLGSRRVERAAGAPVALFRTGTDAVFALLERRAIPAWIDGVLKKAVDSNPLKRYEALSEFVQDLRRPNAAFLSRSRPPLIERNPLQLWKSLSLLLALAVLVLLAMVRAA